jgi:arabinofuranosyltransferase
MRRWSRSLSVVPPLAAFAVFALQSQRTCTDPRAFVDDTFISLRYGANLASAGELTFNRGDRVEGYSNFLDVVIHALTFRLHGGVPDAATAIDEAVLFVLGVSLLEVLVLWWLSREEEPDGTAWYYAGIITLASWPFAFWATAGLETPVEGLLYLAILKGCRPASAGRPAALVSMALVLIAITLLRFEGVIVALAVAAAIAWDLVSARRVRSALAFAGTVLAVSAAYHFWRLAYFGMLVPNTFVAKATGGSLVSRLRSGVRYCATWVDLLGGGLALAGLGVVSARADRASFRRWVEDPVRRIATLIVAVKIALVTWGGGDWMPGSRMLLPVAPLALYLALRAGLDLLDPRYQQPPQGASALVLAAVVFVCGQGIVPSLASYDDLGGSGHLKQLPRGYVLAGELVERAFGTTHEEVAIGEAGLVPYEARDVRFMDLFGLVDRDMARQPGYMHNRVRVAHFLQRAPAAVLFAHLQASPPYGPYQYGPELLMSRAFHEAYRMVDVGPELDSAGWALYMRRDLDPRAHSLAWASADAREVSATRK